MGKHLVDLDEASLASARVALGTRTIKDTVNEALRKAASDRAARAARALDALAAAPPAERSDAWR